MKRLRRLSLHESRKLNSLRGIEQLALIELHLLYTPRLASVAALAGMNGLRAVEIIGCPGVVDIQLLGDVWSLECLTLPTGPIMPEPEFIGRLAKLVELAIGLGKWRKQAVHLSSLAGLSDLRILRLYDCRNATGIEAIRELRQLQTLVMNRGPDLPSLEFLRPLTELVELGILNARIHDGRMEYLLDLPNLERVQIRPGREHYRPSEDDINRRLAEQHPARSTDWVQSFWDDGRWRGPEERRTDGSVHPFSDCPGIGYPYE